ncbi:MAG: DUF6472 family protein [Clostridia bacterium]|nr:DUF6472 family protein [Clostridia bacterium]
MKNSEKAKPKKPVQSRCEDCQFYDYDEQMGDNVCTADIDEDEYARFAQSGYTSCPLFRYYDEYKSVQKQN